MPELNGDNPTGIADTTPLSPEAEDSAWDRILAEPDDPDSDEDETPRQRPKGDDPDGTDSDDDDDAGEQDIDQPRDEQGRFLSKTAKVKLDDGTEATVEDLIQGNLRQADYTRKTQAVAERNRALEAEASRVQQQLQQFEHIHSYTLQVLQAQLPPEPDAALMETDPIGYMKAERDYRSGVERLQNVYAQQQQIQGLQQEQSHRALQQRHSQEAERLRAVIPELKDARALESFKQDAFKYGSETYGFRPEEIGSTIDSRILHLMADAIRWRKLQSQKGSAAKKVEGKPPLSPGRRQEPKAIEARGRDKAKQVLKSTGGRGERGEAALDKLLDAYIK